MERTLQHLATKFFPITARIENVQVPDLVDLIGRRARMAGRDRQECKPPVLLTSTTGVLQRPTILPYQASYETTCRATAIEIVVREAVEKIVLFSLHGHSPGREFRF
jgi:hypothetical protein